MIILYGSSPGGLTAANHQIILQNTYLVPAGNMVQLGDSNETDGDPAVNEAGDLIEANDEFGRAVY